MVEDNKKISYKLLSLDLDGTLLSPFLRKAKKADCLAVQEYMNAGGIPFINTGRAPWAIVKTINRINKYGQNRIRLLSCWNGAYIQDFNDSKTVQKTISHELSNQIFQIVQKYKGSYFWIYTPEGMKTQSVYAYPHNHVFKAFYHLSKLKRLTESTNLESYKIDIISPNKTTVAKIYQDLIENKFNQFVTISHSSHRVIEITPRGINKGYAISYFAKKYKIANSEIVSMGDSFNDLSAFKTSALSIGISPKNPNLLEHCDEVVDHKSKGVSEAIKNYLIKDLSDCKYQLIFTDLDGTLLDNKTKAYSNKTKVALQQCTNHLIPIAIASGRGIYDVICIIKSMELNLKTNIYIIGNNGATIFDVFTNKYISQTPLADKDARQIFNTLKSFISKQKEQLGFIIYQHSSDLLFFNEEFWKSYNLKKTGFEDQYDPWANRKPIYVDEYPKDIICYKYVIKFPNPKIATKGVKELKKLFPHLEICFSSSVNVEINKKGVNKGFAAKKLAQKIKLDFDRVLLLGDGQNDVPAFELIKHSFAPSYAPDFVKKVADHIVENVTVENFASTVIYDNVLKRKKA